MVIFNGEMKSALEESGEDVVLSKRKKRKNVREGIMVDQGRHEGECFVE